MNLELIHGIGRMILTDRQIEGLCNKTGMVYPFDRELLNPQSLDVRLGRNFTRVMRNKLYPYIEASKPETMHTVSWENNKIILKPGECVLGVLKEYINLPSHICARLVGRSSLGRLFIDNSSFAAWIDGGFHGYLTIELVNHSKSAIRLNEGDKIGQLIFYESDLPRESYRDKKKSRYAGQGPAQPSKGI